MYGKKIHLAVLLIISGYFSCFSQEYSRGYIFGNKGDTISGYVEVPPLNRAVPLCFFKPALKDAPTGMSAKDIKGFGVSNTVYISTLIHLPTTDTLIFTRLIFDDLYDLMYFEAYQVKHFIIRRPDSTIFGIQYPPVLKASEILAGMTPDKRFREQTDSIFPDAPDLPEYQKGVQPDIYSFNNLFRQYHNKPSSSMAKRIPLPVTKQEYREGFVINSNNDTIQGLIGNDLKNTVSFAAIFSPGKNENSVRFLPGDIKGFGNRKDNKLFAPAVINEGGKDTSAFVRLILDGIIDLLYYDSYGSKKFLFRNDEKTYSLTYPPVLSKEDYLSGLNSSKKFRIISDSIISALGLQAPQRALKPDLNSILNFLEGYHSSNGKSYRLYNGTQRNFEIGPVIGVTFEKYEFTDVNDDYKSFSDPAPHAGIYMRLTNQKTGTGLVLRNIVGLYHHNYSYKNVLADRSIFAQTDIRSLADNFEAGMTISPLKKLIPAGFFEAGGAIRFYIKPDYETLTNIVYPESDFVMSYLDNNIRNSNFFFGGFIRAGIFKALKNNKLRIIGGYNYLMNNGSVKIQSVDLSAAYMIRYR